MLHEMQRSTVALGCHPEASRFPTFPQTALPKRLSFYIRNSCFSRQSHNYPKDQLWKDLKQYNSYVLTPRSRKAVEEGRQESRSAQDTCPLPKEGADSFVPLQDWHSSSSSSPGAPQPGWGGSSHPRACCHYTALRGKLLVVFFPTTFT